MRPLDEVLNEIAENTDNAIQIFLEKDLDSSKIDEKIQFERLGRFIENQVLSFFFDQRSQTNIKDLTKATGKYFHLAKHNPDNDSNYYEGRRLIGFLIFEELHKKWVNDECVFEIFNAKPTIVEFLKSTTLEDVIRHIAYRKYLFRNKVHGAHLDDYYKAIEELRSYYEGCPQKKSKYCSHNEKICFLKMIKTDILSEVDLGKIRAAKENHTKRLGCNGNIGSTEIDQFIQSFYHSDLSKEEVAKDLIKSFKIENESEYNRYFINCFEFTLKCILCKPITRESCVLADYNV